MSRDTHGEEPVTREPMMEAPKIRDARMIDNDRDDDGFFRFGTHENRYRNSPERRRKIRRAEKREWRRQVQRGFSDDDE